MTTQDTMTSAKNAQILNLHHHMFDCQALITSLFQLSMPHGTSLTAPNLVALIINAFRIIYFPFTYGHGENNSNA